MSKPERKTNLRGHEHWSELQICMDHHQDFMLSSSSSFSLTGKMFSLVFVRIKCAWRSVFILQLTAIAPCRRAVIRKTPWEVASGERGIPEGVVWSQTSLVKQRLVLDRKWI
jgi:hypothetical protein